MGMGKFSGGSGSQPDGFLVTLLSQQGQGQAVPRWGCEGRQGMEMWGREA